MMRIGKLALFEFLNECHPFARISRSYPERFFWLSKTIPIANVDANDNLNFKLISESFKCSLPYSMHKN